MSIVVTGGAGDLGSRVVRELTARGHDVTVYGTRRLADAAYSRARDVAGRDVLTMGELATLARAHRGASAPKAARLPIAGGVMRAFAERRAVPSPG